MVTVSMELKRGSQKSSLENISQEFLSLTSGRRLTSLEQYEDVKRNSTIEEDHHRHSSLLPRENLC